MHIEHVRSLTLHCTGVFPSDIPPTAGSQFMDSHGQIWTLRAPSPTITTAHLEPGMVQWQFDFSTNFCRSVYDVTQTGSEFVRVYTLSQINDTRARLQELFWDRDVQVGVIEVSDHLYTGLYVHGTHEGPRTLEGVPVQYTLERCSVCRAPQYSTPHGSTCANGHGGAPSL